MTTVLNKYALHFYVKHQPGSHTGQCHTTDGTYEPLAAFIYETYWSATAEKIITALDNVLTRKVQVEEFQTHFLVVESRHTDTIFADIDNPSGFNNPDLIIPTVDFRDIVVEWKNFLQKMGL